MKATLSVVATPIGNLGDISFRAVDTLRAAAAVFCEDTRHARRLLDHYAVAAPLYALHEHNEMAATQKLLALLAAGESAALISDAGTPGVSDPGGRAVAAVCAAGYRVTPLPGANAAIAALSAAGLGDGPFYFAGFLPAKSAARRAALKTLARLPTTLVLYEAPHRIEACIADMAALCGDGRELVIARELTKMFEQITRLPLAAAAQWLAADANRRRGEFVLLLSPPPAQRAEDEVEQERILGLLLAEMPLKRAVDIAAAISGGARKSLYARALLLRQG